MNLNDYVTVCFLNIIEGVQSARSAVDREDVSIGIPEKIEFDIGIDASGFVPEWHSKSDAINRIKFTVSTERFFKDNVEAGAGRTVVG